MSKRDPEIFDARGVLTELRDAFDAYRENAPTLEQGDPHAQRFTLAVRSVLAAVDAALFLEPCHTTGMHDPTHTTRGVCELQRADVAGRVVAALGLDVDDLPRRLHENCGWCHRVPGQEEYRQKLRDLHEWAGVPIPEALAAPADDAPREEDRGLVLAWIQEQQAARGEGVWLSYPQREVVAEMFGSWSNPRWGYALQRLVTEGVAEYHPHSNPRMYRLVVPA